MLPDPTRKMNLLPLPRPDPDSNLGIATGIGQIADFYRRNRAFDRHRKTVVDPVLDSKITYPTSDFSLMPPRSSIAFR